MRTPYRLPHCRSAVVCTCLPKDHIHCFAVRIRSHRHALAPDGLPIRRWHDIRRVANPSVRFSSQSVDVRTIFCRIALPSYGWPTRFAMRTRQIASPRSGAGRSANPPVARHTTGRHPAFVIAVRTGRHSVLTISRWTAMLVSWHCDARRRSRRSTAESIDVGRCTKSSDPHS